MAFFGVDSGTYTKADADRKRELAKQLMGSTFRAKNPLGALAMALEGGVSGAYDKEARAAETKGNDLVARMLQGGDWQGAMGSEWAAPEQRAIAGMLLGREWELGDRNQEWAREDARAAAALPGYRPMTPEEKAAYGLPLDAPAQISADGKVDTIGGGGVNVDARNMGSIPAGYQVEYDDQGNPVRMSPIPGSPEALKIDQAADQEALREDQAIKTGNIVVEDVGRAIDLIRKDPTFTTGVFGKMLSGVGGTNANSVGELVKTVKANSAFDQLQAMRAASPTGGALGAVSDTEMGLLQAAIGSLEQSQNSDQLVHNLKRVQGIYNEIVNGPGAELPQNNWTDLGNGIRIREK